MRSTRISHKMNGFRAIIYRALLDMGAVATWVVPTGMSSHVHAFDAREGATISLTDADGGTDVFAVHDGLPPGLSAADNEVGWRMSLARLAELVEAGGTSRQSRP